MKKAKLRILFVNPFWSPYRGGIENVIEHLCEGLSKYESVESIAILSSRCLYPSGNIPAETPYKQKIGKLVVYRIEFFPKNIPYISHLRNSGLFSTSISAVLRDFKPNVVQYMTDNWYLPNLLVFLLTKGTAIQSYTPFYHTIRKSMGSWPIRFINNFLLNRMDSIQVMSEMEKSQIKKMYEIRSDNILKFKLGLEYVSYKPKREKNFVQILSVGRLGPAKGQYELLQSFKNVSSDSSADVRLVLVGGDGGDLRKIEDFILKNSLQSKVKILGYVSNSALRKLYEDSDIYAHLTRYESFGLSFVDAAASRTPIIAYSVGGLPEVMPVGALYATPFNRVEIDQNLKELVENQALREQIGKEGQEYVVKNYNWESTVEMYHNEYLKIQHLYEQS